MGVTAAGVIISEQTYGGKIDAGQIVYLKSDGKWYLARANSGATSAGDLAIALDSGVAGGKGRLVKLGYVNNTAWSWTPGAPLYLSAATAGGLTQTKPTGAGVVARRVGAASSATAIYFSSGDPTTYATIEGMAADAGDVIVGDAGAWTKIAAGTAGQVMATAGAGALPAWADRPKRGAYDAIVYISGTSVVAEDATGATIASGTAGTDDATVIQAAINNLTAARTVAETVVVGHGTYILGSAVTVPSHTNVEILGTITVSGNHNAIEVTSATDVTISGGEIDCTAQTEYYYGLRLTDVIDFRITGVTIYGAFGHCISVRSTLAGESANGVIANCITYNAGDDGIAIGGSYDVHHLTVIGNICRDPRVGISGGYNGGVEIDDGAHDIAVVGNTIENTQINVHYHGDLPPPRNISIVGNVIKGANDYCVRLYTPPEGTQGPIENIVVANNQMSVDATVTRGVGILGATGVLIAGNVIAGAYDAVYLLAGGSTYPTPNNEITISDNIIDTTQRHGIFGTGNDHHRIRIAGNQIRAAGADGIRLSGLDTGTVDGNLIYQAGEVGLRIVNVQNDVTYARNVISAPGQDSGATNRHGIMLDYAGSSRLSFVGNTIKDAPGDAIYLYPHSGVVTGFAVCDNVIDGATRGIYGGFQGCRIANNRFRDIDGEAGIRFSGATTNSGNMIEGNDIADTRGTPLMDYCLALWGADATTIVRNNILGAAELGTFAAGVPTGTRIGNVGYVTENRGAAASTADGGTIAHGCAAAPTTATVSGSVAGEIVTVTSIDATNITVAIKKPDGSAGTAQTVYWRAEV